MKKLVLMMLATLSLAGSFKSAWEEEYKCVDPCGMSVTIVHKANDVQLYDSKTFLAGYDGLRIHVAPNGCYYNIWLKQDVFRFDFEDTLLDSGFTIVSHGPIKKPGFWG